MARARIDSTDIEIARITHATASPARSGRHSAFGGGCFGRYTRAAREARLSSQEPQPRRPARRDLHLDKRRLGDASLGPKTAGTASRLDSNIAQSQIRGEGEAQLTGNYPTRASLTFANIRYTNVAPFISTEPTIEPVFRRSWIGDECPSKSQFSHADNITAPAATQPSGFPNQPAGLTYWQRADQNGRNFKVRGPLIVAVNHSTAQIQQFRMQGPHASIQTSGAVNFRNRNAPLALKVNANADLGVLQDVSRDFYSSGGVALDAAIREEKSRLTSWSTPFAALAFTFKARGTYRIPEVHRTGCFFFFFFLVHAGILEFEPSNESPPRSGVRRFEIRLFWWASRLSVRPAGWFGI